MKCYHQGVLLRVRIISVGPLGWEPILGPPLLVPNLPD